MDSIAHIICVGLRMNNRSMKMTRERNSAGGGVQQIEESGMVNVIFGSSDCADDVA